MKRILGSATETARAFRIAAVRKSYAAAHNRILTAIRAVSMIVGLLIAAHPTFAHTYSSGSPGGPAVVLPDCLLAGGQPANTPIDIAFVTAPDTSVDLASLHVWVHTPLFGWVDATSRLLSQPQVYINPHGMHLDGGMLPPGEHRVRISFRDHRGRTVDATETIRILRSR